MMRWHRTPEPARWSNVGTIYTSGPWKVTKSFYADGPSMFEWVLTNTDDPNVHESHPTLRAAKAAAERGDRASA